MSFVLRIICTPQLWSSSDQREGKLKIVLRWNSSIVTISTWQHLGTMWQLLDSVNWTWKVWRLFDLQNILCAKCAIYHSSLHVHFYPLLQRYNSVPTFDMLSMVSHSLERLRECWRHIPRGFVTLFWCALAAGGERRSEDASLVTATLRPGGLTWPRSPHSPSIV